MSNKSFGTFENVIQKVSTKFLNFSFQFFYKYLSKIASQGWGIEQHLGFDPRKLIINVFIISQFSCAPVMWMFQGQKHNRHINGIHEKTSRVTYKKCSCDEFLENDNSLKTAEKYL